MSGKEKSPLRQKDIRTGAQQERARVLKILDEWVNDPYGDFDTAVALIKEDNK